MNGGMEKIGAFCDFYKEQVNYALRLIADGSRWSKLEPSPTQAMWTDDFSNILSIFRWR